MLITNARLADGRTVDLEIADGAIAAVTPSGGREPVGGHAGGGGTAEIGEVVDVGGWLVLPAMAEPHAHLDKALTAEMIPNPTGDLAGAIEAWTNAADAGAFTHDDMVARIRAALEKLVLHGVTAVRSHVNCGGGSGVRHLMAVQEAIAPYADIVHVELVALLHSPMTGPEGADNRAALAAAIEAGIDLVGGCPHLEPDGRGSIEVALSAARDAGLPVDLHVDETLDPTMATIRDLARAVVDRGHDTPVTASHCVSLGSMPVATQEEVAGEVAAAGISIITLPQTNLFLQGRDHPSATPRGLTALRALVAAGVRVAAGADNVQDPFNLIGRSDPLETAALMVLAGHVPPDDAYDMVANEARRVMGLAPVRFEVGDPADLVAVDAPSIRATIADAPAARKVFRAGRLVAETTTSHRVDR